MSAEAARRGAAAAARDPDQKQCGSFRILWVAVSTAILLCLLPAPSLGQPVPRTAARQPQILAITDTTIINPRKAVVRRHATVLVRDGRIASIRPASSRLPRGAVRIDGRGRFLIPGLWDAHSHVGKTGRNALTLYLANGVTGVRDMGSNLEESLSWIRRIEAGELAGPRIRTAGPMLEARSNIDRMRREATVEDVDRQRIGIANAEEGRAAVRQLASSGVHHIKMRTTPDAATFAAVAAEAARLRLPFAAHPVAPPAEMLAAGLDAAEHFVAFPPLSADSQERMELFRRMAGARMHVTNTDIVFRAARTPYAAGLRLLDDARGVIDPRRKYVCGYVLRDWREQVEENKNDPYAAVAKLLPTFTRQLREMHRAGVPLLAGSDAGVMFVYPGFSLLDQLELMVTDLGFEPMEVLRIATNAVPEYFGEGDRLGSIEAGQLADLLLLDADPLQAIGNVRKIRGVVAQGRWYDRKALDALLAAVARDAAGPCEGGSQAGRR